MSFWDRLLGRQQLKESLQSQETTLLEVTSKVAVLETKLQEASAMAGLYDPDMNLTAAQGGSQYMRRLTQSARDFTPLQHTKAIKLAFWLSETNPIARRILVTTAAYIVGDGFKATSNYDDESRQKAVQDSIDYFWDDQVNLMDLKLPALAMELGMWGELCLICQVNPVDGLVRFATVDPERIKNVIMDKTEIVALELTAENGTTEPERLKIIRLDEDPQSETFGYLIGAKTDSKGEVEETWQNRDSDGNPMGEERKYLGSCMFFRVNNITNARRGRSDLLSVIDWLDAYDSYLFNEVERSALMRAFAWDVTLKGMEAPQIRQWLKENGAPKPGAIRAHNEEVTWESIGPDLKTQDSSILGEMLLAQIATGAQYPKTWLNVTDDVNKATGQVLDEPTFRFMSARQRYLKYIITQLVFYQLDQQEIAGILSQRPKVEGSLLRREAWEVTIDVPELRTKDMQANAETFAKAMEGLMTAVSEHFIDEDAAQKIAVLLAEQFGVEIDLDEMRKNIETAKKEEEEALVPPVVPPVKGGPPAAPGAPPPRPGTQGQPPANGRPLATQGARGA